MADGQAGSGGCDGVNRGTSREAPVARGRMAASANLALACGLAVALGGAPVLPASAASEQQARVCRSLLLVLNPADARINLAPSRSIGLDDGVTLTYDVEATGQKRRFRRLTCAFARTRSGDAELIAVSSDGRSLGPARLTFLKRFWINSRDAAKADRAIAEKH